MATATTERLTQTHPGRERTYEAALRDRVSLRTIALAVLGSVFLLVLTAVLAAVRISYRPRRGC